MGKINDKFGDREVTQIEKELSKDALHADDERPQVYIPEGENIEPGEVDNYFELMKKEVNDDKADLEDSKKFDKSRNRVIFRKPDSKKEKPNSFGSSKLKRKVIDDENNEEEIEKANVVKMSKSEKGI